MKWKSIKKYLPPTGCDLFIRALNKNIDFNYERYFSARAEDLNEIHLLENWDMCNEALHLDIQLDRYEVTHFCIPDAIEIEL